MPISIKASQFRLSKSLVMLKMMKDDENTVRAKQQSSSVPSQFVPTVAFPPHGVVKQLIRMECIHLTQPRSMNSYALMPNLLSHIL